MGQKIVLNELPYEVIGVLPPAFHYPRSIDIWVPTPRSDPSWGTASIMTAVGRLQPGVRLPEVEGALRNYAATWNTPKGWGMTIVTQPFLEYLGGRLRPVLLTLMGASCY